MEKYKVNLNIDVYVEAESFNDAVEKAVEKFKNFDDVQSAKVIYIEPEDIGVPKLKDYQNSTNGRKYHGINFWP